jgi:hypothetical protein
MARILPLSQRLETFLIQRANSPDSDSTLALASFAAARMDDPSYFVHVAELNADLLVAFAMACRLWSHQGRDVLVDRALSLQRSEQFTTELREAWSNWCQRLGANELIDTAAFLASIAFTRNADAECSKLAEPLYQQLVNPKQKLMASQSQLSTLRLALQTSLGQQLPGISTGLVKCLAYLLDRHLVLRESKWIIVKDEAFAMPKTAFPETLLPDIVSRVLKPPSFFLPYSRHLARYAPRTDAVPELVCGEFPSEFKQGDPVLPRYLKIWDGQRESNLEFSTLDEMRGLKLTWRPRFRWS